MEENFKLKDFADVCKDKHQNPEGIDFCKECLRETLLYMGSKGLIACGCDRPECEYHDEKEKNAN